MGARFLIMSDIKIEINEELKKFTRKRYDYIINEDDTVFVVDQGLMVYKFKGNLVLKKCHEAVTKVREKIKGFNPVFVHCEIQSEDEDKVMFILAHK